eukprot:5566013-Amphidinium_carterae.1
MLYLVSWAGMLRGWWNKWSSSPLAGGDVLSVDGLDLGDDVAASVPVPSSGADVVEPPWHGAAGSAAAHADEPGDDIGQDGKDEESSGKQKKRPGNMHLAARVLSRSTVVKLIRMEVYMVRPLRHEFSEIMAMVKSTASSHELACACANGRLLGIVRDMARLLVSPEYARRLDLCPGAFSEATERQHQLIADCAFRLFAKVAGA